MDQSTKEQQKRDAEIAYSAAEAGFSVLTLMAKLERGKGKSITIHAFGEVWIVSVERVVQ